jgi:hypothetical protein
MDDLLEIPPFLIRNHKKSDVAKPVFADTQEELTPNKKYCPFKYEPPQTKRFKGAQKIELYFGDEAPAIGSGHITVWAKVGYKWVYLCDRRGKRATLRRSVYNTLKKRIPGE